MMKTKDAIETPLANEQPSRAKSETVEAKLKELQLSAIGVATAIVIGFGGMASGLIANCKVSQVEYTAESADAKSDRGVVVAAVAKTQNDATYEATKAKVDESAKFFAAEIKALREEVEALKRARPAATRRPRKGPTRVPLVVAKPLPDTPAAAVAEQATEAKAAR